MPFVRFSRDKRGYEHTYLIHAAQKKGAPARVLYWYRTPPGVKVGRPAFDDELRRALEAQYPNIAFDWPSILSVSIQPVEVEHWRERRRAEKAAKQARQAAVRDDGSDDEMHAAEPFATENEHESPEEELPRVPSGGPSRDERPPARSVLPVPDDTPAVRPADGIELEPAFASGDDEPDDELDDAGGGQPETAGGEAPLRREGAAGIGGAPGGPIPRRRRRGGRRRRRPQGGVAVGGETPTDRPEAPAETSPRTEPSE